MAKVITDEKIKLSIEINGNAAQKDLIDLEKSTRKLSESNKQLLLEKKRLESQGKKDTAEYKSLTASIKANNLAIDANKEKMKALQNQIGITGLTLTQLRQKATVLRATLSNMIPGTEDFRRYQAELTQVNARIGELTGRAAQARFSLSSLADGFNRYQALALSFVAALTGVILSVQKIIDINGKLSDAQSDVMKTTGMTKDEVNELTKSFGALKTRTARIELLGLATEAGRLGIEGVANVQAFVEQANKMKVALGDDLSDEAIREVGKMVNVYRVGEQTGRDFAGSMDALGSSINEVSASGANQAGYLVDYLKRQAGIAAQAKLSAADNIGYAATFDEIGQSVEVSATAMNKVWMDMFTNPGQYAKIAGMSIKDFNQLLTTDSNEAMIRFLEGLKGNDAGLQAMMESLKDLEVGGARGVSALSALANNTELLRKRQITSNQALIESTSLTNEYDIKNNNLAATLEKLQKTIVGMFSSEGFVNWLSGAVDWIAKFVGATEDAEGSATNWRNGIVITAKVLAVLAAALITNIAWQKLVFLWTTRNTQATWLYNLGVKARAVAEGISIVVTQAYAAMTMLLRGNILGATQALRVMTATMLTTPWGLLLAGIAAVTAAYFLFRDSTEKATLSQKTFAKIQSEVNSGVKEQRENLDLLLKIARDQNESDEVRLNAIKKIKAEYPGLLDFLTLENVNTDKVTAALNRYITALNNKLELEAVDSELKASKQRALQKEATDLDEYGKWYDGFVNKILGNQAGATSDKVTEAIKRQSTDIANETTLQGDLLKKREDLMRKMLGSEAATVTPGGETPLPTGETEEQKKAREKASKEAEDARKKRLEELKKSAEERLKIERELEDEILRNMDEGYKKEWQLEQTNWTRRIEDLQNRMVQESEIEAALKKSKNSKLSAEERNFWSKQADAWITNNAHVQGLIETAEKTHQTRLSTIQENAARKEIDTDRQSFEAKKVLIQTELQERLNQIGISEHEKERLKKEYQQKELDEEEKFLNQLIQKFNIIVGKGKFNNFDLSLLTPEQVEQFTAEAQKVGLTLQEFINKKNELAGKGTQDSSLESLGLGGQTDIFGFTPENWEAFFSHLQQGKLGIEDMVFAVGALTNMWSQYSQFLQANEAQQVRNYEKTADRKKTTLKRQLDTGLISQTQYNRAVETLDTQLDKRKAEIEYNQAKRQKAISIANIIRSTAEAIIGLWANPGYPMAIPLTALVGAMGALQLATVAKTPLPAKGYEDGLYPMVKREQDGKMFKASGGVSSMRSGLYRKSTILVGEGPGNQPEMVIDKKTYARISPQVQDALLREIRGVRGFESGYYDKSGTMQVPVTPSTSPSNNDNGGMLAIAAAINRNSEILEKIDREGILAKVLANDYKSLENLKEGMDKYNELKSKSRK
jgi:tubulin-specific chaperone A